MGWFATFLLLGLTFVNGQISLATNQKCGMASLGNRVVNGEKATAEQAPWNVILELKKNAVPDKIVNHCGGSIITRTAVITAGHCVWGNSGCPEEIRNLATAEECHDRANGCPNGCFRLRPQDVNVYPGISRISPKDEIPKIVNKIYLHDKWDKKASGLDSIKMGHDVAILQLKKKLTFNPKIQPICLPYQNLTLNAGTNVIINGFGITDGVSRERAEFLQQGRMKIVDKGNCTANYNAKEEGILVGDQLCSHGVSTGVTIDSCSGDSGSGLVTPVGTTHVTHVLVGLVSFGVRWCNGGLPGVYTNVQSHMEWIKQILSDIQNGIGPQSCPSHESCETKENCPYIKQKYDDFSTANAEEKKQIVKELKSLVCSSQKKTFCCPVSDDSSCPSDTVCSASSSCDWYNEEVEKIKMLPSNSEEYINVVTELKQSICNKNQKKICCPQ